MGWRSKGPGGSEGGPKLGPVRILGAWEGPPSPRGSRDLEPCEVPQEALTHKGNEEQIGGLTPNLFLHPSKLGLDEKCSFPPRTR